MLRGASFLTLRAGSPLFLLPASASTQPCHESSRETAPGVPLQLAKPACPSQLLSPRAGQRSARCARLGITSAAKAGSVPPKELAQPCQEAFPERRDQLRLINSLLLTSKMQGCYIRNLCTRQRAQRGGFFYYFLLFFFLSSWQLHVQPEARAGCAARSRHRGSRPEHPTARKSCEKGKKKGTSSAKVAEVGSELRTLRPPAAARGC